MERSTTLVPKYFSLSHCQQNEFSVHIFHHMRSKTHAPIYNRRSLFAYCILLYHLRKHHRLHTQLQNIARWTKGIQPREIGRVFAFTCIV